MPVTRTSKSARPAPKALTPAATRAKTAAPGVPANRLVRASRVDENGSLFATVGSKQVKLADAAIDAWVLGNGRYVAWSGADGAGISRWVGQSLRLFDSAAKTQQKVMSEYTDVKDVKLQTTPSGKEFLMVKLASKGQSTQGIPTPGVAIVDPKRGQVFGGALMSGKVKGDTLTLDFYREKDFQPGQVAMPYKQETRSLEEILSGRASVTGGMMGAPVPAWPFPSGTR